jgi:predicted DNA-binding ribbon-helix-helix protein
MCHLFISQDPNSYAAETRPVRLHGHVTSIRLEAAFWDILEQIAEREEMPVARFASVLHDEVMTHRGEVPEFRFFSAGDLPALAAARGSARCPGGRPPGGRKGK